MFPSIDVDLKPISIIIEQLKSVFMHIHWTVEISNIFAHRNINPTVMETGKDFIIQEIIKFLCCCI